MEKFFLENPRIYSLSYDLYDTDDILRQAGIDPTNKSSREKLAIIQKITPVEQDVSVIGELDYDVELAAEMCEYGNINMLNCNKLPECMQISSILLSFMNNEVNIYEKILELVRKIKDYFNQNGIDFDKYLEYVSECTNKAMEKCYQRDTKNFETFYEYLEQISCANEVETYIQKIKIKK